MKKLFCFILTGWLLSGCGRVARPEPISSRFDVGAGETAVASKASFDAMKMPSEQSSSVGPDRMVAYSARVDVDVENAEDAQKSISSKVKALGGYVGEESKASMVVFIPAKDLDGFLEYLDDDVGDISDKSVSGRDVTESHGDTAADLASAKAARDRYAALLRKANKVDEVLGIEKELERVNAKILRLEQQLARSAKSVEMSRVLISLSEGASMDRAGPAILALSLLGGLLLFLL